MPIFLYFWPHFSWYSTVLACNCILQPCNRYPRIISWHYFFLLPPTISIMPKPINARAPIAPHQWIQLNRLKNPSKQITPIIIITIPKALLRRVCSLASFLFRFLYLPCKCIAEIITQLMGRFLDFCRVLLNDALAACFDVILPAVRLLRWWYKPESRNR